ncbi:MAG: kinesin, partial [Myxococcales bacterium]|nr:kinesin [Polyangiaceae bacterium]MDW8251763.1 kinesin [Myxococcales bacterium]
LRGPSYEALEALRRDVVAPLLGQVPALLEEAYRGLLAKAERAIARRQAAEEDRVVALEDELRTVRNKLLDEIATTCHRDLELKPRLDALDELEKLLSTSAGF